MRSSFLEHKDVKIFLTYTHKEMVAADIYYLRALHIAVILDDIRRISIFIFGFVANFQ